MASFLSPYCSKYFATAVPKASRYKNLLINGYFLRFGGIERSEEVGGYINLNISKWNKLYRYGIVRIARSISGSGGS